MSPSHPAGPEVVIFGEVLYDRFPDQSEVLGGAPFNVAWNLKALGADPLLISRVGSDSLGQRIQGSMTDWGLRTDGLQLDDRHATGTVEVTLENGEPVFDIVDDRAYDHIETAGIPGVAAGSLLYHGSLAARANGSRAALEGLIEQCHPSIFFDVNLRPPWWEKSSLEHFLRTAAEVKMNEDELSALVPEQGDLESRAQALLECFPIQKLYVTRGGAGALAFTSGGERVEVRPKGEVKQVDTVGAGDAFASVLILGRLMGWAFETTMHRAQEFAGAVVGLRGAVVLEPDFYLGFHRAWSTP